MPSLFINNAPKTLPHLKDSNLTWKKVSRKTNVTENQCHGFSMTKEEFACLWVETQKSHGETEAKIKEKLSSLTGLTVTDKVLSFSANYLVAIFLSNGVSKIW